jgi:hypothetical protein
VLRRFVIRRPSGPHSASAEAEESSGWKCTLVGLPFSSSTLGGRDEVILPFCSMGCATFSFERDDQETVV